MNITPATFQDAFEIASVHVRSWRVAYAGILSAEFLDSLSIERRAARWQDILHKRESQTLLARQAVGVSGFISFGHWRDDCSAVDQGEIWALYIKPEVWGEGVGRALLDVAVRELQALGRRTVNLWVLEQNDRALRFYEAFGFRPVYGSSKWIEFGGCPVEEVCLRLEPTA